MALENPFESPMKRAHLYFVFNFKIQHRPRHEIIDGSMHIADGLVFISGFGDVQGGIPLIHLESPRHILQRRQGRLPVHMFHFQF